MRCLLKGKLWFLESGKGSLSYYSFLDKKVTQVASLPGFTRGIDFCGNLAFIGLSKVRESATFGGIPLTPKKHERICGVWVVNLADELQRPVASHQQARDMIGL